MEVINLICFKCKHFSQIDGCEAFKDGDIPFEVMEANKHDKPIKGQENDIVFEEIK